ncbi:MAG: leucine-rich repeat domain-containing protein [Bacteroidaceae bacterium]|jgi:hypothetical protein|nr:leucine-rich repeat domain-containing protein [Bacteroidaceae bacterium]
MKRAFLTLIAFVMALLSGTKAYAYDCEVDGIYYYRISTTELEVANKVFSDQNRSAYTGTVTIPSTVTFNGKKFTVVSIGEYAFRDCTQLTSVTIPNSIRTIKDYAFYNCSQIIGLTIPDSVTSIGVGAFEGCSAIVSMKIPNGVPAISDETFYGCTALKTLVLPASVASIGAEALTRCTSLLSLYLGATTPPGCEPNAFEKVDRTWVTVYVPKGGKGYTEDKVWKDFFIDEFDGKVADVPQNGQSAK